MSEGDLLLNTAKEARGISLFSSLSLSLPLLCKYVIYYIAALIRTLNRLGVS